MGFSLKKIGGLGKTLVNTLSLGLIGKGELDDQTIGPDAEAGYLKGIKLRAAQAEERGLKGFEERLNQPIDQIIKGRIARENAGLQSQAQDQERAIQSQIARRGLQNSSIGLNAMRAAGEDARQKISSNMASFAERLDAERLKRLSDFRNAAGSTLSGTDVGIQYGAVQKDGLKKDLIKGAFQMAAAKAGSASGAAAAGG